MGGVMHARLRNLATGTMTERNFRTDETVEEIAVERQELQFLYQDGPIAVFMSPSTFDQVEVETAVLGKAGPFLADGMMIPLEFADGHAIGIVFPEIVELKVVETAPPAHAQGTSVWKDAKLENGVTLQVPPFIAPGEIIRVHVQRGEYVERAKKR
jgi:elongation factor P